MLLCTRFPTSRRRWLAQPGRDRIKKIARKTGKFLFGSVLLVTAMVMMGGDAMIGSFALQAFVALCGTAGSRVWSSNSPS